MKEKKQFNFQLRPHVDHVLQGVRAILFFSHSGLKLPNDSHGNAPDRYLTDPLTVRTGSQGEKNVLIFLEFNLVLSFFDHKRPVQKRNPYWNVLY